MKKWTLISFISTNCEPCIHDTGALANWYKRNSKNIDFIPVISGRWVFRSEKEMSRFFQEKFSLPVPVAIDKDGDVTNAYCDKPLVTPFHVLLDPSHKIRMVQRGREDNNDSMKLIEKIEKTMKFSNTDNFLISKTNAIDGALFINNSIVNLSSFWKSNPVILNFVSNDCSGCQQRIEMMDRIIGNKKNLKIIYLYGDRISYDLAIKKYPGNKDEIAFDLDGLLEKKYKIQYVPRSFLIFNGKVTSLSDEISPEVELQRIVNGLSNAENNDKKGKPNETRENSSN